MAARFRSTGRPKADAKFTKRRPASRAFVQNLIRTLTALLLVLTLGLQWTLLQTVAWTGMIFAYSRDNSIRQALSMTFDGQHPCCLCKVIKQGRAAEKQQENEAPLNKLTPAMLWQPPFFCFDSDRELIFSVDEFFPPRAYAPPKPRPRADFLPHSLGA